MSDPSRTGGGGAHTMSASSDLTLDAAAEASLVTKLIQCVIGREARPSRWDRDVDGSVAQPWETDKSPHLPRWIGRRDVCRSSARVPPSGDGSSSHPDR